MKFPSITHKLYNEFMEYHAYFAGKRVTVMRLGLLGRGVGDTRFLAEHGAEVLVVDDASQAVMQPSVDALSDLTNVRFKFGPYDTQDFIHTDFVLKGAGAPLDSPEIAAAHAHGVPVKMSATWFAELAGIPTIGVTGTRGKTTTTYMLYEILKAAGKQVLLGGNIRGVSTLALLSEVQSGSVALMELDSWQCQGWRDAKMSPNIAVFTTFMRDHMNYYKNDSAPYLDDKAQIFLHQKPEDTLVVSDQVLPFLAPYTRETKSHVRVARVGKLELSVPGVHNQLNASCALEAARALNIPDSVSLEALKKFNGVAGRLEHVRTVNGIKIYNDTTATTPDATLAALRALNEHGEKKIVLILGGDEKNLDMSALVEELTTHCAAIVLFKERGTERIRDQVFSLANHDLIVHEEEGLQNTVTRAFSLAKPGQIVLFSPAFSSFGKYFKNEFDRGDQFNAFVAAIPELALLKPKVRVLAETLIEECKREGISIIISRGYRSVAEQDVYYEQGRTTPGKIITMVKGGSSFHNYGVAFDVRPLVPDAQKEEYYRRIGPIGKKLGLVWGGEWKDFVDLPHYEYTAGYTVEDFKNGTIDESKFV